MEIGGSRATELDRMTGKASLKQWQLSKDPRLVQDQVTWNWGVPGNDNSKYKYPVAKTYLVWSRNSNIKVTGNRKLIGHHKDIGFHSKWERKPHFKSLAFAYTVLLSKGKKGEAGRAVSLLQKHSPEILMAGTKW